MNYKYIPFNKFLIRTPAFPFKYSNLLSVDFDNVIFQEAIYIASKELFLELNRYLNNKEVFSEKDELKLRESIGKYWKRMITRTTPYGLFSGVSFGSIAEQDTEIIFTDTMKRNVRLDMEIIFALVDLLQKDDLVREEILYYPNDTLYKVGDQMRFYERSTQNTSLFKYSISKVDYSVFLNSIITFSSKGRTLGELAKYICEKNIDISFEEAKGFINEIVDSNLIISELNPCLTGGEILDELVQILRKRNSKSPLLQKIEILDNLILNINSKNGGIDNMQCVESHLIDMGLQYNSRNIFQVDLYKDTEKAVLNSSLVKELEETIQFLTKVNPSRVFDETLENFKKAFSDRFEDREINLLFATDSDVGIGYPVNRYGGVYSNSLLKNFYAHKKERNPANKITWDNWQELMLKKMIEARENDLSEIILSSDDFLSEKVSQLYPTFFCSFEILNDGHENLVKLNGFGGASGALLMSRFSHLNEKIENFVKEVTAKEQEFSKEPILEIIHVAFPRVANVLIRPQMRNYELVILGNSKLSEKHKIPLSDIMISIRNNKVILRSKSLNKIIKVANTNAFNHDLSTLPAYNLLCDLQYDNDYLRYIPLGLNINLNYIPRIRYKNILIEVATWQFKFKEIENFQHGDFQISFKSWREKYKIPRFVLFCEKDNELIFDFDDKSEIYSFYNLAKKKEAFILKEILFNDSSKIVTDKKSFTYRNEFIIAFKKITK